MSCETFVISSVLSVGLELPIHVLGVDLLVEVALGELLPGLFDALHLPRAEDGGGVDDDGIEQPNEQPAPALVVHQYEEYEPDGEQPQHYERRAPDYGYHAPETPDAVPDGLDDAPDEAQDAVYDGVPPPLAALYARCEAQQQREDEAEGKADNGQQK